MRIKLPPRPQLQPHQIWFAIILTIVAIGIIFTILIPTTKNLVKQEQFLSTNFDGSHSQFRRVNFDGQPPSTPPTLPNAYLDSLLDLQQNLLASFTKRYNLTPHQSVEGIWLGETHSLTYDPTQQLLTLTRNELKEATQRLDKEQLLTLAQTELSELLPDFYPELDLIATHYWSGKSHLIPASPSQASLIQFDFAPRIEGVPVYLDKNSQAWVSLVMNADQSLQRMSLIPLRPIIQLSQTSSETLAITEAVNKVKKRDASIISVGLPSQSELDLSYIEEAQLSQASLEYRIMTGSSLILPYYRFTGTMTTPSGNQMSGELIVSALKVIPSNQQLVQP